MNFERIYEEYKPKELGILKGHEYSQEDYKIIFGEFQKKRLPHMNPNGILANPGLYAFVNKDVFTVNNNLISKSYIHNIVYNEPYTDNFIIATLTEKPTFFEYQFKDLLKNLDAKYELLDIDSQDKAAAFEFNNARTVYYIKGNDYICQTVWEELNELTKSHKRKYSCKKDILTAMLGLKVYRTSPICETPICHWVDFKDEDFDNSMKELDLESKKELSDFRNQELSELSAWA